MMSAAMLEQYRKMTPKERFAEFRALMEVAVRALEVLTPEERARRLAAVDRIRLASKEALLRGLAAAEAARVSRHEG